MTESDRAFVQECLTDRWCRTVIEYLRDTDDGTASLDRLVDQVLARETESTAPDRETVAYEVTHVHLPRLVDHGVVEFDERTETVRMREASGETTGRPDVR